MALDNQQNDEKGPDSKEVEQLETEMRKMTALNKQSHHITNKYKRLTEFRENQIKNFAQYS